MAQEGINETGILKPGHNCWRLVPSRRVAFLIDGETYFAAFRAAVEQARESILILGWDIDNRIRLVRDDASHKLPVPLAEFLNAVVSERPELNAYVLIWDYALVYALERELLSLYKLRWLTHRRFHFQMDSQHPKTASHHQKVVVVDDKIAFVGGFDLTRSRWDTQAHRADDPRRVDAGGSPYLPFHDVQMLVDSEAAAALGELARERWRRATGETIPPPRQCEGDPWPRGVQPDLRDLAVAIARTESPFDGRLPVREVEQLYLDAIAGARHWIYLENQYLTAATIGEALARRLADADGPETVLVLPRESSGWLEHTTMDVLRARLLRRLREADRHRRLRVYYPDGPNLGGTGIFVHAKVLVVDDDLARIGSSNFSNRSMALDTECDLAVAAAGEESRRKAIARLRNRLLAEHLGTAPESVAEALGKERSLIQAIERLRGGSRTLRDLEGTVPEALDQMVPDAALVDPERPLDPESLTEWLLPKEDRQVTRRRLTHRLLILLAVLGLAGAWLWTPLGEWLDLDTLLGWIVSLRGSPVGPAVVIGGFVVGGLVVFPVTLLILATGLMFGPLLGFVYAMAGTLLSAAVTYGVGHLLGRDVVSRLDGPRITRLSGWLSRRGLLAMMAVRFLPVAPFTLVNMVAGAFGIPFRNYWLGTLLGMTPGMLALTVFADGVVTAVRNPEPRSLAWLGAVVVLIVTAGTLLQRWLRQRAKAAESISESEA